MGVRAGGCRGDNGLETMTTTRPTRAEISRSKLIHNHDVLRRLAGAQTELLCVVKANAYGHGLAECARALELNGARWFGVTCVEEGVELRRVLSAARGDIRILAMSGIFAGEAEAAVENNVTPAVWELQHLDWLDAAARRMGKGAGEVAVHLEIDSGMSRQGVVPKEVGKLVERIGLESPLRVEALMTHFYAPEDTQMTGEQTQAFVTAADTIRSRGMRLEILSAGSSAGTLQNNAEIIELTRRMDAKRMLRAGIGLYGYAPSPEYADDGARQLRPVLAWKTRVIGLREIEQGTRVGYDGTFSAERLTRLALLPVGYADGLNRLLSNRGAVIIRGQRAPIAGRISMDQTVVDVTDVDGVEAGDEVVLIGKQAGEKITAADMARMTGTISYEVLCAIAARVPRVMVD
jgi:alanine racemase